MLIGIILFLLLFTVIALFHEGGHYFAAKKAGIQVLEFGIGFGPKIFSVTKNGTIYSLNLIPILAFVNLAGMDESEKTISNVPEDKKYFSKPPISRFFMAFCGPLMNIVLAFLVLLFTFSFFGMPDSVSNTIGQIQKNSVAEKAGLKAGDTILELNGKKIESMEKAISTIHKTKETPISLKIQRGEKTFNIKAIPQYNEKLKVSLLGFSPLPIYKKVSIIEAFYYSSTQVVAMIGLMFKIIGQLAMGGIAFKDLAGPIGIAQITGKYVNTGAISFLTFFAFLNVNIGVLNLLPLPALDGGHIVFALIEMITKRRVAEDTQKKVHGWGMLVLLTLMFLITINDLLRILQLRQ